MAGSGAVQAVINIDWRSDFTSEETRRHEEDLAKKPSAACAWFGGCYARQPAPRHRAAPISHGSRAIPRVLFIVNSRPRFLVGREAITAMLR